MEDSIVKAEEPTERKPASCKSWKKKYRKMRVHFEHKMREGEDLHKDEAKAAAMVKRLAVENEWANPSPPLPSHPLPSALAFLKSAFTDHVSCILYSRLLDLLLEINNCPQIPVDKRMDVSLKPLSDSKTPSVAVDQEHAMRNGIAMKHLQELLADVPHMSYTAARTSHAPYVKDLHPEDGESFPATFLTADDVDNYIFHVDSVIETDGAATPLPSLAPHAQAMSHTSPALHPHLKNPTSVTNWLRKHAPKIFLQDGEANHHSNHHSNNHHGDDEDEVGNSRRKSKGGAGKADRAAKAVAKSKRASVASKSAAANDWDPSVEEDHDFQATPVPKGKRKRDDDPGYRPKGGSGSRPTKKKRKSEGDTPTARRLSKKEIAAAKGD